MGETPMKPTLSNLTHPDLKIKTFLYVKKIYKLMQKKTVYPLFKKEVYFP